MSIIINDRTELASVSTGLRSQGKRIVTTNGAFDIVHIGHIRFLQFCKSNGDILIVGVNTDSSLKQFKGDKRPIIPEQERAELIASLSCVDYVHIFSERTPEAWLDVVKPSVHVKAGDYTLDRNKETPKNKIWERDVVEKNGGHCLLAPLVQGRSTTGIIEKINEVYGSGKKGQQKMPAVFLDRDGTIIQDKEYMHKVEDLEFIPGAIESLKKLSQSSARIFILSNQSGIARELFTEIDAERFSQHFIEQLSKEGIRVDGVYLCPHHPQGSHPKFARDCSCRKPKPGMVLSALQDHAIDLQRSVVVGDKTMDIMLGNALGIKAVLVKTGKAGLDNEYPAIPDFTAPTITEAVDWMINVAMFK